MRLIEFPHTSGVVQYPDYEHLFKNTKSHNGKIVGEYYGMNLSIADYTGDWPVVATTYKKEMSKTDFKSLFTPSTYRAISVAAETDDIIFQFWDMAQTADDINVDDARTIQAMGYLLSQAVITQNEHDTVMMGKPE
jgi:hypothetical protein